MRLLHIGCYGIPKIALPGVLPPLDAPAPETQWRDTLCSWMPRIKAAGFDCVASEVRTPAMVDAWLGAVKNAAEHAGLRFGTSWQFHDCVSLVWPEWCASPTWGKDTSHPMLRSTASLVCFDGEGSYTFESGDVTDRLTQTFGGPLLLNMEGFFGVCKDFPKQWGEVIGAKLGKWLRSLADDGHQILWYHPDENQSSSSAFEKAAYAACRPLASSGNVRYCRTAGVALQGNDASFSNHAAANRWGITTAQWKALPATDSNPAVLSVAFDKIDAVLRDMGV